MKKEIDAYYMIKKLGLENKPKLNLYVVLKRFIFSKINTRVILYNILTFTICFSSVIFIANEQRLIGYILLIVSVLVVMQQKK